MWVSVPQPKTKKVEYADTHFHLFRTAEQLKVRGDISLSKILRHYEDELSLAVASVCDPKFLQSFTDNYVSLTSDARLRFAVGIHPKKDPSGYHQVRSNSNLYVVADLRSFDQTKHGGCR